MIFKEYIDGVDFEDVWVHLLENYPYLKEGKEKFEKVWKGLSEKTPDDCNISINIMFIEEDEPEDNYWDVHGLSDEEPDTNIALDYCRWEEWLGMEVVNDQMSRPAFIAHCLWEMTFHGFDDGDIQRDWDEMMEEGMEIEEAFERFLKEENVNEDDPEIEEAFDKWFEKEQNIKNG